LLIRQRHAIPNIIYIGKIYFSASLVAGLQCEDIFMSEYSSGHEYSEMLKKIGARSFVKTKTVAIIAYGQI
jgi:hypothetical protein